MDIKCSVLVLHHSWKGESWMRKKTGCEETNTVLDKIKIKNKKKTADVSDVFFKVNSSQ